YIGRRLALVSCAGFFATGMIGTGLFTSIPQSCLFLLLIGWVGARQPKAELVLTASRHVEAKSRMPAQQYG
ncbi:MAG TPA: hypothetical protein VF766_05795, partial [Pyrinomonadaceae bacterium]